MLQIDDTYDNITATMSTYSEDILYSGRDFLISDLNTFVENALAMAKEWDNYILPKIEEI